MRSWFRSLSTRVAAPTVALGLAAWAFSPATGHATMIPAGGVLDYTVLRNGDPIGTHVIRFAENGDTVDVRVKTNIKVKLAFITVYHFSHEGHEKWREGKLVELDSKTDDDGTDHVLKVLAGDDGLMVDGDGVRSRARKAIIPASLWHAGMVRSKKSVVLNTLDGTKMAIKVDYLGEEEIKGEKGPVMARHYVVKGDLQRELWYDPNWVLVKVRFKGSDGSDIQYVLK